MGNTFILLNIGLADDSQQEPARKVEEVKVIQNQSAQIVEAPEMHLEVQIDNSEMVIKLFFFFKSCKLLLFSFRKQLNRTRWTIIILIQPAFLHHLVKNIYN